MSQSYVLSKDYKSLWSLGFELSLLDVGNHEGENVPEDVRLNIQRLASAIFRNQLPARSKYFMVLGDDSIFTLIFQIDHFIQLLKCIHRAQINKKYLSNIFIKRADLISWCETEFLSPPKDWQSKIHRHERGNYDSSDDENDGWYEDITERRKKRVACLELAKKLWEEHPDKSYEQIYNDPVMKKFGNPNVFSFDAFKKWARKFAPDHAKEGGRPIRNK